MPSAADAAMWARLRPLFDEAVELQVSEQDEFVRKSCGGDEHLENLLRRMLSAHAQREGMLDRSLKQRLLERVLVAKQVAAEAPQPCPPAMIGDRYEIERELGAGGFGRVYLAKDAKLQGRHVAVKVLHPNSSAQDVLDRELTALARVRHPSVSSPIDSGVTPEGVQYLVLEYVPGQSLRQALVGGRLSPERTWNIALALASALQVSHDAGVWHLDLKPSNILLRQEGSGSMSPVLVDFGIARSGGSVAAVSAGSLAYSAPEQLAGKPSAASDQYSFALILLEMLTNWKPQPFENVETGLKQAREMSTGLARVLKRALSKEPAERYPSIADFISALRPKLAPAHRHLLRPMTFAALSAALVVVVWAGFSWHGLRQEAADLSGDLDVLEHQISAMAASSRFTRISPQIPNDAMLEVIKNLQARVDRGSRDPRLLHVLSNGLMELGMLHGHPARRSLGHSEEGAALMRRSLELAELLRRSDPGRAEWVANSAEKHSALASVLVELGQLDECTRTAQAGLALLEPEEQAPLPGDAAAVRRMNLRVGLTMTLSRVPFERRQFAECLRLRDLALAWKRAVVAALGEAARRQPDENGLEKLNGEKLDLAGHLAAHGYLLREMGRYQEALNDYQESDALGRVSLARDPQDMSARWLLARNTMETGHIYVNWSRPAQAREKLEAAIAEMKEISAGSAMDVQALRLLALAHSYLAAARAGEPAARLKPLVEMALNLNAQAGRWDPENSKIAREGELIRENAQLVGVSLPAR
ncbi:MAG: serine/threonine protein kinase [Acidobacteria bacterium]|nr:serine/threonine protein kinase [Acidobacteriota bacterium]